MNVLQVGCYWNLSSTTTSIDPFSLVLTSEVKEEFYLSRQIQISLRVIIYKALLDKSIDVI